jgi:hypothetical protein
MLTTAKYYFGVNYDCFSVKLISQLSFVGYVKIALNFITIVCLSCLSRPRIYPKKIFIQSHNNS